MNLLTVGINHQTAPLAVRERAAFADDALAASLRELTDFGAREATILSTCNRTEIYCGYAGDDGRALTDWFARRTGLEADILRDSVYQLPNEHAVRHAFRVAAGLDSMVLGEPQILGQMKRAFAFAFDAGATGKLLNRLFQQTFSVAKQVRTDTAIGANSVGVAYTGVHLARRVFANLREQRALLIGAGETIELTAAHLHARGLRQLTIANRSPDKAQLLARAVGGEAIGLADIPAHLPRADLVVSCTASTLPLLGKGAVERALKHRRHKPMCIIDLAVPRDVESEVRELADVYLYTLDDLQSLAAQHRALRQGEAEKAGMIIELHAVQFMRWMRSLDSVATIRQLRDSLTALQQAETARAQHRLAQGDDPNEVARQLARRLTRQFAHYPSEALRESSGDGDQSLHNAARKLFDL